MSQVKIIYTAEDRLFRVQRRLLQIISLWPASNMPIIRRIIGSVFVLTTTVLFLMSQLYFEFLNFNDFTKVAYSASEMLKWCLDLTKFTMWIYYWEDYRQLIEDFGLMWQRASKFNFWEWKTKQRETIKQTDMICMIYHFYYFFGCAYVFYSPTLIRVIYKVALLKEPLEPDDIIQPVAME